MNVVLKYKYRIDKVFDIFIHTTSSDLTVYTAVTQQTAHYKHPCNRPSFLSTAVTQQ